MSDGSRVGAMESGRAEADAWWRTGIFCPVTNTRLDCPVSNMTWSILHVPFVLVLIGGKHA